MSVDVATMLADIRTRTQFTQEKLAQLLGVSFVSINKWERGAATPSPAQANRIAELYQVAADAWAIPQLQAASSSIFSSRGVRRRAATSSPTLFDTELAQEPHALLADVPQQPILSRLVDGAFVGSHPADLAAILSSHRDEAPTTSQPPTGGMSAGKNTYTYDAHTYHTKVPPQGIAELLKHYLPAGGLVIDPFSGSGMTGVASRAMGYDVILNELSPAACFISNRFVTTLDSGRYAAAIEAVLEATDDVRKQLYTTTCRECGRSTELLYTVWSYCVVCNRCGHEFQLWDHCRKYGKRVRDHKILTEFPCPACHETVQKSRLQRTTAEPVQVGYMCCGSRQQEATHAPNAEDLALIAALQEHPPLVEGWYPQVELPAGVNLQQPKNHGITRTDLFYTPRNLAAMSHLWQAVHRIEDDQLAAHSAFTFTSLYQRVTRLSEFRFWGGSGNTARFNVPYIFNESNVFVTFARKARTIQDHLESTASHYHGRAVVVENSATALAYVPDSSVDLVFTDPPFGANINYSEMNILWEAWLGQFTDTTNEAIVNRVQGKDIEDYQRLMAQSLAECFRVLRPGHWMLLVFMNSSSRVWEALREAIQSAGFDIKQVDIFDKQHGTFKHFVSENTAGCDLVLHCLKPDLEACPAPASTTQASVMDTPSIWGLIDKTSVQSFLERTDLSTQRNVFLHVAREEEVDYRKLYSEWMAAAILEGTELMDFAAFRKQVLDWLRAQGNGHMSPS